MTKSNITVDAPCPLIKYTPDDAWTAAKQAQLPTTQVSLVLGASAEWTFNGTGIWLYGSKEDNHGFYNVTLDDRGTVTLDGYAGSDSFNEVLYSATGLKAQSHHIKVVNAGPMGSSSNRVWFSLDYAIVETDIGGNGAQVSYKDFDDKDSRFQYLPDMSYWVSSTSSNQSDEHYDHTVTRTASASGIAQFSFTGDAVAIYGALDPTHGNFAPTLDGRALPELSTYYPTNIKKMMIFYADGLGEGSHVLQMQNKPTSDSRNSTSFDYATVWTGVGGSGGGFDGPGKGSNSSNKLSVGAMVGIITGAVLLLAGAIIFLVYLRRRQIARRPRNVLEQDFTDFDGGNIEPYIDESPGRATFQPQHGLDPGYGGGYPAGLVASGHSRTPDSRSWGSGSAVGEPLLGGHATNTFSTYSGSASGSGSGSGSGTGSQSTAYTYYAHNSNHSGPTRSEKRAQAYGYHVNELGAYVPNRTSSTHYASPTTHRLDPSEVMEAEMEPLNTVREEEGLGPGHGHGPSGDEGLLPPHYGQAIQPWRGPPPVQPQSQSHPQPRAHEPENTASSPVDGLGPGARLGERTMRERMASIPS